MVAVRMVESFDGNIYREISKVWKSDDISDGCMKKSKKIGSEVNHV